jgi:hypothetical protein
LLRGAMQSSVVAGMASKLTCTYSKSVHPQAIHTFF